MVLPTRSRAVPGLLAEWIITSSYVPPGSEKFAELAGIDGFRCKEEPPVCRWFEAQREGFFGAFAVGGLEEVETGRSSLNRKLPS